MRITRTRPYASESEPASRISALSVMRYASTTHCCVRMPPPSSRLMAGSATVTTVPSRKVTKDASTATATTSRCTDVNVGTDRPYSGIRDHALDPGIARAYPA